MTANIPNIILLLLSFWIEFWYVKVVPKYLNCSTLSKELLSRIYNKHETNVNMASLWMPADSYSKCSTCQHWTHRKKLHAWTANSWITGEFQELLESSQILLYSTLQILEVTEFCSINRRLQMSPDIKKVEKFKPGERAGNAVGPPFPIHFYKNPLFKNLPTARRKFGGPKRIWFLVLVQLIFFQ